MLLHGLQGSRILIPTRRDLQPDRDFPARTIRERLQPPLRGQDAFETLRFRQRRSGPALGRVPAFRLGVHE